ncbi:putative nucleotide-binding protein [Hydrogenophaga palleronii]|uniref:Nucleotide-binding protein n=1 Tax=Hydrogenophaga palleronii TaxID=65655 RepID=A0ABU1WHK8_9BURK|nr:nucleotide-binding protein [Hydrogenophaga palleronii]MDR7148755.1 putative nucleotide-binding protein [Hydrogenophaga palleronii]
MERTKKYEGYYLSELGWRNLIQLSEDIFGEPDSIHGNANTHNGTWTYDKLEDFVAGLNPNNSDLFLEFSDSQRVRLCHYGRFGWEIKSNDKKKIVQFETSADNVATTHIVPLPEIAHKATPTIFIGHGRDQDWRALKDHLQDKHEIEIEAYEVGSRAGHTIRDVLEDMLDGSELAILVHTPEDELADGSFNSRPNVIHETGLFQGKLGFSRAIILMRVGVNEFSNISGVQQIRYATITETFGDVLAWIKRESHSQKT